MHRHISVQACMDSSFLFRKLHLCNKKNVMKPAKAPRICVVMSENSFTHGLPNHTNSPHYLACWVHAGRYIAVCIFCNRVPFAADIAKSIILRGKSLHHTANYCCPLQYCSLIVTRRFSSSFFSLSFFSVKLSLLRTKTWS